MKRYLFVVLAAVAMLFIGCTQNDITVRFEGAGAQGQSITMVAHTSIIPVSLDENGCGECVLAGVDAVYAKVYYGQKMRTVYLENGDNVLISFDANDYIGTFSLEGDKAAATDYLNSIVLTPLPDEAYALELDEFTDRLEDKQEAAVKIMKAHKLRSCGKFMHMEEGRIRYSYGNMLLMYPVGHGMLTGNPSWKPSADYYDEVEEYFVEDEDWVNLSEYRNFMVELSRVLDKKSQGVRGAYNKAVAQLAFMADNFKKDKIRQVLMNYLASSYVDFHGIDNIQELTNLHKTYVTEARLCEEFQQKYDKWDRAKPGKPSPDFSAEDLDGKVWTLADFKGKYLYIDLWATWCGPCKREFPYLKELEKEFEGDNIVFLGLSTDGNRQKWEEMLATGALSGVQLYVGQRSSFQQAYNIDGIPRFILLDRDGIIINPDMTRPSSPDTKKFLESLDGIRK